MLFFFICFSIFSTIEQKSLFLFDLRLVCSAALLVRNSDLRICHLNIYFSSPELEDEFLCLGLQPLSPRGCLQKQPPYLALFLIFRNLKLSHFSVLLSFFISPDICLSLFLAANVSFFLRDRRGKLLGAACLQIQPLLLLLFLLEG